MTPQCGVCGKFIKLSSKTKSHFTPDSDYSIEDMWFECSNCLTKENK